MSNVNKKNSIYYNIFYNAMYVFLIILAVLDRATMNSERTMLMVWVIIIAGIFFILDWFFDKIERDDPRLVSWLKFFEVVVVGILEIVYPDDSIVVYGLCIFNVILAIDFIIQEYDFDETTISLKKIVIGVLFLCTISGDYIGNNEDIWLLYSVVKTLSILVVLSIVTYIANQNVEFKHEMSMLRMQLSDIEDSNEELHRYQEKVKQVNEEINFQKINLSKAYSELEEANVEIASQTEVMRFMSSTFDIQKCLNIMADAVMQVKKPKLCAIYIDKNVYYNKTETCIIKTDYSSMLRRLKKEISYIYDDVEKTIKHSTIIEDEMLRKYKFVGDTNINTMAVIPMKEGKKIYGMMLVASDKKEFFEKGLNYYKTCMVEFGVSIKSARLYLKMEDMARKDGLTGIFNRLYFNELFKATAKNAVSKNAPLSVALFDIDKFKLVNDTYGHLAGDEVIKMVASLDQKYAELYDGYACRYGGEEFLLVFPNKTHDEVLPILEEMHNEIKSTPVEFEDYVINVNVSIGLSSYPDICNDTNMLVSRADKAMYYSKRNGRGRLVLDSEMIYEAGKKE